MVIETPNNTYQFTYQTHQFHYQVVDTVDTVAEGFTFY